MVSVEKISSKFIKLDEYLGILEKIAEASREVFVKDRIITGSAKYYLQVSIEVCLDVANHIIASKRLRAPTNYADAFAVLEENDIVNKALGQRLKQMTKFRNRLVHLYGEVDDFFVYEFIKTGLADIRNFQKIIMQRYAAD